MNDEQPTGTRYPDCHVTLLGTSVHPASVMLKVSRGLERYLREEGATPGEVRAIAQEFLHEAQSGDYDNVLTTAFRWVDVN